jgi:hypothetical protein
MTGERGSFRHALLRAGFINVSGAPRNGFAAAALDLVESDERQSDTERLLSLTLPQVGAQVGAPRTVTLPLVWRSRSSLERSTKIDEGLPQ